MQRWMVFGILCAVTCSCIAQNNTSEEQIPPPAIELTGPQYLQTEWPIFLPDIPWQPPAPRPEAKTPFAPLFLKGNNIFTGEKEYWLADAVAKTQLHWPKRVTDSVICDYLKALTDNLGRYSHEPQKHYEVEVIDLPYVNAFSAGGGRIYLTRGLLRQVASEDELAGVIAHEMGHDNFHHAGRTMTRQFFWVIGVSEVDSQQKLQQDLAKFLSAYDPEHNPFPALGEAVSGIARADEQSADKAAFYFLYRAGYNPMALPQYFRRAPDPTLQYLKSETGAAWPVFWTLSLLFDSHPPAAVRAMALDWESNFIKLSTPDSPTNALVFAAMKSRLKYLDEQDAQKVREAQIKKLEECRITATVRLLDEHGPVLSIAPERLKAQIGGSPAQVVSATPRPKPVTIVMIDASSSMKEEWAQSLAAAKQIVAGAGERVAVVVFRDRILDHASGPQAVNQLLDRLATQKTGMGGTAQYDALIQIAAAAKNPDTVLVVIGDGEDNASRNSSDQTLNLFLRNHWPPVFGVVLDYSHDHTRRGYFKKIVVGTGGLVAYPSASKIGEAASALSAEINAPLMITLKPSQAIVKPEKLKVEFVAPDGKPSDIQVAHVAEVTSCNATTAPERKPD